MRVAVLGASGFVGGAAVKALQKRGHEVLGVRAPRLEPVLALDVDWTLASYADVLAELRASFASADADAVVNAAGISDASSKNEAALIAANAVLPVLIARAANALGVPRFVHVSSAVVQGRLPVLDESPRTDAFSAYSKSKALGETQLLTGRTAGLVIYRPASVHGPDRRVTRMLATIANSPFSSVASPGASPTPQAHIDNVADAIAFLATTEEQPPPIVMHPTENHTTESLLRLLSGRKPVHVPRAIAKSIVAVCGLLGHGAPGLRANVRRLEMVWFGQGQARAWLEGPWERPATQKEWEELGQQVRARRQLSSTNRQRGTR